MRIEGDRILVMMNLFTLKQRRRDLDRVNYMEAEGSNIKL
jgi:hypothetical protein